MKITNKKDYIELLGKVELIMDKGESNATPQELEYIGKVAPLLEEYEDTFYPLPTPENLLEMVELKLFEQKMTQTDFCKKSGMSLSKINQIIKGNRKIDIPFIKAAHDILGIPADYIFSHI